MADGEHSRGHALPRSWATSELVARVASAAVLGALTLFVTYVGGLPYALFWLVAGIAVVIEWMRLTRIEPRAPFQVALSLGLALLTAAYLWGSAGIFLSTFLVMMAMIVAGVLGGSRRDRLWAAAGFACAAVLVLALVAVRSHPGLGLVGVLWMFAVVWATDVVAYFVGRRVGGPKLWPQVSPKKTWSGFAGGLAAGTIAGVVVPLVAIRWGATLPMGLGGIALVSALGSIVGQLGDLAESALKRRFGVKDSSNLIPGHGGVMDRLDALWAVALMMGLVLTGARLAALEFK
jgi:phosphatidate cytidylyltransferase